MNQSKTGNWIGTLALMAAAVAGGAVASRAVAPTSTSATLTLPATLEGEPGDLVQVQAEASTDAIDWDCTPHTRYVSQKAERSLLLAPKKAGVYTVTARVVSGSVITKAQCVVTIAGQPEPPVPPPAPPGPGPNPPTPPSPPSVKKLFVVIIEDTATPFPGRAALIGDAKLQALIKSKGYVWRLEDKNVVDPTGKPPADLAPYLAAASGKKLPYLFLVNEAGKPLYEGELPATAADLVALIGKVGG